MYKNQKVAVVVPAYNEEKLIQKTIDTVPAFVDLIIVVNDQSKDKTADILNVLKKKNKRLTIIHNSQNGGVGFSIKAGLQEALASNMDLMAILAGDAQMDPQYLDHMIDDLLSNNLDYIKANRFMHLDALKSMPTYRRFGNVVVTILTKFATGYYSIFDSQNGYAIYKRSAVEKLPFHLLSNRYDYENTVLIGLSIIGAKVGDIAIPAVYGEEKSTINFLPTVIKTLRSLFVGFWRRIYYKYILYNFHPIALFLISGTLFNLFGLLTGMYITFDRYWNQVTPTTGTVMLCVLPLIVGLQQLLTALVLDVLEERRG